MRRILAKFLKGLRQKETKILMSEGYQETSVENSDIVAESRLLQAAATEGAWKWDDE